MNKLIAHCQRDVKQQELKKKQQESKIENLLAEQKTFRSTDK